MNVLSGIRDPASKNRRPRPVSNLGPGARTLFRLPPELDFPLTEIPQPIPVTAFRALLEDPYLWALQRLRGLDDPRHDLQELDPMGFGTLAHGVLERFARSPEAADLYAKLEDTLKELDSVKYEPCPENLAELEHAGMQFVPSYR